MVLTSFLNSDVFVTNAVDEQEPLEWIDPFVDGNYFKEFGIFDDNISNDSVSDLAFPVNSDITDNLSAQVFRPNLKASEYSLEQIHGYIRENSKLTLEMICRNLGFKSKYQLMRRINLFQYNNKVLMFNDLKKCKAVDLKEAVISVNSELSYHVSLTTEMVEHVDSGIYTLGFIREIFKINSIHSSCNYLRLDLDKLNVVLNNKYKISCLQLKELPDNEFNLNFNDVKDGLIADIDIDKNLENSDQQSRSESYSSIIDLFFTGTDNSEMSTDVNEPNNQNTSPIEMTALAATSGSSQASLVSPNIDPGKFTLSQIHDFVLNYKKTNKKLILKDIWNGLYMTNENEFYRNIQQFVIQGEILTLNILGSRTAGDLHSLLRAKYAEPIDTDRVSIDLYTLEHIYKASQYKVNGKLSIPGVKNYLRVTNGELKKFSDCIGVEFKIFRTFKPNKFNKDYTEYANLRPCDVKQARLKAMLATPTITSGATAPTAIPIITQAPDVVASNPVTLPSLAVSAPSSQPVAFYSPYPHPYVQPYPYTIIVPPSYSLVESYDRVNNILNVYLVPLALPNAQPDIGAAYAPLYHPLQSVLEDSQSNKRQKTINNNQSDQVGDSNNNNNNNPPRSGL